MWKTIVFALAVAALGEGHVVLNAPQKAAASTAPAAGKTFAATCRGDQVLDLRPDPQWVGQSFAGDRCQSPPLPVLIDGARASRQQVVVAMAGAKRYRAAADSFQRCVERYVAARRAALSQAQLVIENHRLLVSQRAKLRAQQIADAEVNAFNEYGSDCPDH